MTDITTGDRVYTKFGYGTVTSDYWRDRDRYRVRLDDGSQHEFSAEGLNFGGLPTPAQLGLKNPTYWCSACAGGTSIGPAVCLSCDGKGWVEDEG